MNTCSQLIRCLGNFKEKHFFLLSQHLYTAHSEPNKARDGITQLNALRFPSLAWSEASKIVGPNRPRNFSRLSASGAGNTAYGSVTAREHNNLTRVWKNVISLTLGRQNQTPTFSVNFSLVIISILFSSPPF